VLFSFFLSFKKCQGGQKVIDSKKLLIVKRKVILLTLLKNQFLWENLYAIFLPFICFKWRKLQTLVY